MNTNLLELSPHSFALSIKLVKPFVVIMCWIPFFLGAETRFKYE